jgi:hypothetical protein
VPSRERVELADDVRDNSENQVASAAECAPVLESNDPLGAQPLGDVRRNKLRNERRSAEASCARCLC